jgi:HEAT repeat protein
MGFIIMIYSLLLFALLLQNPSLDSESPKERQAAVEQMATLGNRAAIPQLAAALKKESRSDTRASMIAALGRIRDREAVPVLADTLKTDLDKDVRLQAIDSLLRLYIPIEESGQIRTIFNKVKSVFVLPDAPVVGPEVQVDAAAKEALASAMQKDFSDDVRAEAARALGILKAKDQVPVLTAALLDAQNREHSAVRVQIAHTLGMLRDPASGPALEKVLRDSDQKVAQEAILAIGLAGYSPARGTLEQIFRTDSNRTMKSKALEALSLMRDKGSVPLFESLLNDKNDYYRELAAEGLARVQYSNAKGWKQVYEQEKKQNVRNALAFGLAESGDTDYINDLANALSTRQSFQVEVYLFELGKFDGKLNELYRYLRSTDPKVRGGIARIIGNIGDPASADQIRPLRDDQNADVVREAVDALRKLSR